MATAKIANLFNVAAPEQAVVEIRQPGLCTPAADPHYQFNLLVLKKVMMWLSENAPVKNLFILGDAGTGKTSLILEVAARLGIEVWSMSCSGKTRFNDLVGTLTIDESGATRFVDGPLAAAARSGGVFLANEITRMEAGEQMRLVDILDGRARLTIPETGEVVIPHPNFRVAVTGNSGGFGDDTGAYAGERRGSLAFFDRFIKLVLPPFEEVDEVGLVMRYAPSLREDIVLGMVRLARDIRKAFVSNGGGLQVTLSTRSLIAWARLTEEYAHFSGVDPIREALHDTLLNGAPSDDRSTVLELFDNWLNGGGRS